MKNIYKILLILLLLPLGRGVAAEPFWQYLNGPNIGNVVKVVTNSKNDIFAATDNGIYKSIDGGLSWIHLIFDFQSSDIWVTDNDKIIAMGYNRTYTKYFIKYSDDFGQTFKDFESLPFINNTNTNYYPMLKVDKKNNIFIFKYNLDYKDSVNIIFSNDWGKTWKNNFSFS